jgi:tetratricopeptide (TPR) repeat protein
MTFAETELATGNLEKAIGLARQVLETDATHVGALEVLAKAQWQTNRFDELLLTLARLVELNPYEPGYHSLQACAYQCLGMCGEAVKSHLRAVDLGYPESEAMVAMVEELRAWQASLVSQLLDSDPVFRAAYQQDPAKACADRGFDFATPPETTEHVIREREFRAVVYDRHS